MASEIEILIDSDAFVGRFYPNDKHHDNAKGIFSELEEKGSSIATTSMVVAETATVLSHRSGQDLARTFISIIEKSTLPVIHIDDKFQQEAITIFKEQDRRGTSMTDCANIAVIRRFKIQAIFSFDKVYFKRFRLKTVGKYRVKDTQPRSRETSLTYSHSRP